MFYHFIYLLFLNAFDYYFKLEHKYITHLQLAVLIYCIILYFTKISKLCCNTLLNGKIDILKPQDLFFFSIMRHGCIVI